MGLFQNFYQLVRHFNDAVLAGFGRPIVLPPLANEKLFRFPANVSRAEVSDFIFARPRVIEKSKHHQFTEILTGGEHRIHDGFRIIILDLLVDFRKIGTGQHQRIGDDGRRLLDGCFLLVSDDNHNPARAAEELRQVLEIVFPRARGQTSYWPDQCGAQTTGLALLNASTLAVDLLAKQAYSHKSNEQADEGAPSDL